MLKDEALRQQNIAPFVSLKLAELLIFFGNYFHHAPSHALGLIAKGDALRCIGYHQAALEFLDAAGKEFLQLADKVGWARSRVGWILSAAWLGRTEEALQEAACAHEVLLQHGKYARACMIDNNTATRRSLQIIMVLLPMVAASRRPYRRSARLAVSHLATSGHLIHKPRLLLSMLTRRLESSARGGTRDSRSRISLTSMMLPIIKPGPTGQERHLQRLLSAVSRRVSCKDSIWIICHGISGLFWHREPSPPLPDNKKCSLAIILFPCSKNSARVQAWV